MSIKPGIYPNMTIDEYHDDEALSKTGADKILKAVSKYEYDRRKASKDTKATTIGDAIHAAALQPDEFKRLFIDCKPPVELDWRRTRAALLVSEGVAVDEMDIGNSKASTIQGYIDEDETQALIEHYRKYPPADTPTISEGDLETAKRCADAILSHPEAREYLDGANTEQSAFWKDPETGIMCRCRPDAQKESILADIKSTRNASPYGFPREMGKYNYHLQNAWYSVGWSIATGIPVDAFVFIAVETSPVWREGETHEVAVYQLASESHQRGLYMMREAIETFAEWQAALQLGAEFWTGYPKETTQVDVPTWA